MVPESGGTPQSRTGVPSDVAEPPALREIDRYLGEGEYSKAVLAAFPLVMVDVQRAFGAAFPAHWTARDVLAHGLRTDAGNLPTLLIDLYRIYEPVRFGRESDHVEGDVRETVRRIYAETVLGKRVESALPRLTLPKTPLSRPSATSPPVEEVDRW